MGIGIEIGIVNWDWGLEIGIRDYVRKLGIQGIRIGGEIRDLKL